MASKDGSRGRQGVSPPAPVLPDEAALAQVAKEAIAGMHRLAHRNPRAFFTTEELRAAVEKAQPHRLYQIYVALCGGEVPRTPLGADSDIGERLRRAMLAELAINAPQL